MDRDCRSAVLTPPVLVFVPGHSRALGGSASQIATVVATSQSIRREGTYTVEVESAEGKIANSVSVIAPDGSVALRVVEADYRPRLSERSGNHGFMLLHSARFALLGLIRLLGARRHSKTGRHRWFFAIGFITVLLLVAAFVAVAVAALVTADVIDTKCLTRIEKSVTDFIGPVKWGAALATVGGVALWLRAKVLAAGEEIRQQISYIERDLDAAAAASVVNLTIDELLQAKEGPPSAIHVLAYSFGSLVILDALFPRSPPAPGEDRVAKAVSSLVTVGCPLDFVRQFYPAHFERRHARRTSLQWTNVFLPEDVLASNFLDNDDHTDYESAPPQGVYKVCGVAPSRSIAVGTNRATALSLLSLRGFQVHSTYWNDAGDASLLEKVIDTWTEPPAAL